MTCEQGLLRLLWGGGARSWSATALPVVFALLFTCKIYAFSILNVWKFSFLNAGIFGVLSVSLRKLTK